MFIEKLSIFNFLNQVEILNQKSSKIDPKKVLEEYAKNELVRRVKAELDAEGIPFGIVDYAHPKFQQAYPDEARAQVFRSDIVSDDPSKNIKIIHEDFDYFAIDEDENYNQLKVCVGRIITPVQWRTPGSGGLYSDERQTGFFVEDRASEFFFGFVLGKFDP